MLRKAAWGLREPAWSPCLSEIPRFFIHGNVEVGGKVTQNGPDMFHIVSNDCHDYSHFTRGGGNPKKSESYCVTSLTLGSQFSLLVASFFL